jgi:hypothetical protein
MVTVCRPGVDRHLLATADFPQQFPCTQPNISNQNLAIFGGPVGELVGIRVGVVFGVMNLESSGVEASNWRLRHDATYHEARFLAACD